MGKTCPWCRRTLPVKRFYDAKLGKSMKVCQDCLWKRRRAARGVNYTKYIKSLAWVKKKQEYIASGRSLDCYICGATAGTFVRDMHHRTYARLGHEKLDDLVPLCRKPCHARVTRAWNKERKKPKGRRKTLWQVTEGLRKAK